MVSIRTRSRSALITFSVVTSLRSADGASIRNTKASIELLAFMFSSARSQMLICWTVSNGHTWSEKTMEVQNEAVKAMWQHKCDPSFGPEMGQVHWRRSHNPFLNLVWQCPITLSVCMYEKRARRDVLPGMHAIHGKDGSVKQQRPSSGAVSTVSQPVCLLPACLSACLSVWWPTYLSVCLSASLLACLPVCVCFLPISVNLSVSVSSLSVCLVGYESVCLHFLHARKTESLCGLLRSRAQRGFQKHCTTSLHS